MKRKTLLTALLPLAISVSAVVGLASCQQQTDAPPHVHTFGEWQAVCGSERSFRECSTCDEVEWQSGELLEHQFSEWQAVCGSERSFRECSTCGEVEWRDGEFLDHQVGDFLFDAESHWKICTRCESEVAKATHTIDGSGYCIVCEQPIGSSVGLKYELLDDNTYAVVGYSGESAHVIIPNTYNELPVSTIGARALQNNDLPSIVTSVVILDGVTTIADLAFAAHTKLARVVIPETVTSIGQRAFNYCHALTEITIPDSVQSIGAAAFNDCSGLMNIYVNANHQAYQTIDGNLYTKDGLTLIQYVLAKTATSFTVPDGVTTIAEGAFAASPNLTQIILSNSVQTIATSAFYSCRSLMHVNIPDGVTIIEPSTFGYCTSLQQIVIPNSVQTIGPAAFLGSGLTSLAIPSSVKTIGTIAFSSCDGLTELTIPDSVTDVGNRAFGGCENLTSVTAPATAFNQIAREKLQTVVITSGERIDSRLFRNCYDLTSVTLANTVTRIGERAFEGCRKLTKIILSNSLKTIIQYAFYNCVGLTQIVIPDSVEIIDHYAFESCSGLKNIYYKGTVSEWANMSLGHNNSSITNATKYYYIENQADVPTDDGNYWHYDENGEIAVW